MYFPQPGGCVPLIRHTQILNSIIQITSLNCFKFSHNSHFSPKTTSIHTSIKPLYFLAKLNFQTIYFLSKSLNFTHLTHNKPSKINTFIELTQYLHYNKVKIHPKHHLAHQNFNHKNIKIPSKINTFRTLPSSQNTHLPETLSKS